MTWTSNIEKAIELAETFEDIEYIEDKILNSPKRPNYRTQEGRDIRDGLLYKLNQKAQKLSLNQPPF